MDKYNIIKQKNYTLKIFDNKELSKIVENLSFDEAYKLGVPEEALAIYPGNYWHVKLKNAVLNEIMDDNITSTIIAYFEEPIINIRTKEIFMFKN
jgi:hypothetical protein